MRSTTVRLAMVATVAVLSAACGKGAAPPASVAPSDTQPPSDATTTVTEHVGADQLRRSFLSRSLAEVAHDTKVMLTSRDPDALVYLDGVWGFKPDVVAELDADFIRSIPVRAYMANVLAQLAGNNEIKIDLQPVREALRSGLAAPDRDVNSDALIGLGYVAEASDVDRFVQLANGSDVALAKLSVAALANACGQYASEKLDGFINQAKNPEVKQIAEAMRSQLKEATATRCAVE